MIDRGEPYMMMEKMAAAKPQKIFLLLPWRTKREMKATAANMLSTNVRSARILPFSLFGANTRKMST